MTKQEVEQVYGQGIYQIQMNIAVKAFARMIADRPIPSEFGAMAVTALNASREFIEVLLGNPGPALEHQGDRTLEDDNAPQRQAWSGAGYPGRSP